MSSRRRARQRRVVLVVAVVAALAMILPFVLPLLAAAATPVGGTGATAATPVGGTGATASDPADTAGATAPGPVVLIGTTGLRWEDLSALATPSLWELTQGGASANMVVRSVRSSTCPADGWLAVSAGRRAADVPMAEYGTCRDLAEAGEDATVAGWSDYLDAAGGASYDATPGLFGDLLAARGVPAVAIGPGAAIALATSDGVVAGDRAYASTSTARLGEQVAELLPGHALTVVDVGDVRDQNRPLVRVPARGEGVLAPVEEPGPAETPTMSPEETWLLRSPQRVDQVSRIDRRVGAVVSNVRAMAPHATIVLASLADSGSTALMQVVTATGPGLGRPSADGALANTRSTRQPGMVQSTDLLPTLLTALELEGPAGLVGAPFAALDDGRSGAARVGYLTDVSRHAVAVRPLVGPYYSFLVLANLLLYAVVTLGLNRRILDGAADHLAAHRGRRAAGLRARVVGALRSPRPVTMLRTVRAASVLMGAVPLASYLANLLPWWRADEPGTAVYGATAVIAAALTLVALHGPWRRNLLAPVAMVAGATAVVLAVDVVTGARLQLSALMGVIPQVGGRFYGFNNSSFSLFAAASILLAMCVAEPLVRRGRRRWAAGAIGLIGVVAVVLDGAPTIGADFGGPPALIPGFLVLGLLAMGVRLTWRRVVLVLGVTAVLAASFSVVDWLRPPGDRSHLGRFVETVLDGGLWSVVARKAGQNLSNLFGSTLTFLVIGGIIVVVVLLTRPLRAGRRGGADSAYGWLMGGDAIGQLDRAAVMLRPTLVALATTFAIAFAANDSGIVLPAIGIALTVPLLVSVVTGWLLAHVPAGAAPGGGPPDQSSGSSTTEVSGADAQAR
ncbi:MAG: hypothetical protein ACYC1Z_04310 [Georgenia sp.]